MNEFLQLINREFTYGFACALFLFVGGWILNGGPRRIMRTELRNREAQIHSKDKQLDALREQLHTQMEINQRGNESLKRERDLLQDQVKNLEINVATLQQKPGRAERRQLQLYQNTLDRLFAEAPGFATAWQNALGKSEQELGKAEQGIGGFLRTVVQRALPAGSQGAEDEPLEEAKEPTFSPHPDKQAESGSSESRA